MPQRINVPGLGLVEFPDGMSDADMSSAIKRTLASKETSGTADFFKSMPGGVLSGLTSAASALGQSEAPMTMPPEQAAQVPGAEKSKELVEQNVTGPMYKPEGAAGRYGASVGEALGNPAGYVMPGGPVAKVVTNVLSGLGAQVGEELTGSPVGRFIGGTAGAMLPGIAARIVTPSPISAERQATVSQLRSRGVEPDAGDVTGSQNIRHFQEMGNAPLGGTSYTPLKEGQLRQYTAAVNSGMGEIADVATPPVINRARDNIGNMIEGARRRLRVTHDQQFGDDLVGIEQDLFKEYGSSEPEVVERIVRRIEDIRAGFVTRSVPVTRRNPSGVVGTMNGDTYEALTRRNEMLDRAIKDPNSNISYYAQRVRDALDDAAERTASGPGTRAGTGLRQALEDLQEGRRRWYNMIVASKAVAGGGPEAARGLITPERLRQALTDTADRKLDYASRRSDLHDLAHAGNEIMTPLKSSGTGERTLAQRLPMAFGAAGGALLGPLATGEPVSGAITGGSLGAALGPGATGRVVNSRPMQAYLKNQLLALYHRGQPPSALAGVAGAAYRGLINDPALAGIGVGP